jgi:hypothetical protein
MTTAAIDLALLDRAWPLLWPLLEPALLAAPGEEKPDVKTLVRNGKAQLFAIVEDDNPRPIAAIVTEITTVPETRCRLWLVGGSRMREWAADFLASIEPWARSWGCTAIWGTQNRPGWARIVRAMGGEQVDMDGQPVWLRRI